MLEDFGRVLKEFYEGFTSMRMPNIFSTDFMFQT